MQIIRIKPRGGCLLEALSDLFLDALLDSLRMLPFLFGAYLLMEWMEHRSGQGMEAALAGARRLGPVTGALLGCVPQCGFSVVAANLYAGGIISAGTLVAVFLSTSDEAVPLLLGDPSRAGALLPLLGLKVAAGILVGTAVDWTAALLARHHDTALLGLGALAAQARASSQVANASPIPAMNSRRGAFATISLSTSTSSALRRIFREPIYSPPA